MHGISTGREGIPCREGQFRFTALWGALIPSVADATPSFIPGAPRGIYSDYFIAALLSSTFKGSSVNADGESLTKAGIFYSKLRDNEIKKKEKNCTVILS